METPDTPKTDIFDTLGFRWDRDALPSDIPVHSRERVLFRFKKMMPEFVWDASVLEGNPITFPEVKTLMEGITVGGRKISDHEQVLNLAESSKALHALIWVGRFALSKSVFTGLNDLVARQGVHEWGKFRGEGNVTNYTPAVALGEHGRYHPQPTQPSAPGLNFLFQEGVVALQGCEPFEQATAFFLFGALQQFFFDGNKRTSRHMMNGVLMSHGIDAISIPAARAQEFNEKMVRFYRSLDGTEMMAFIASCHPDAPEQSRDCRMGPGSRG